MTIHRRRFCTAIGAASMSLGLIPCLSTSGQAMLAMPVQAQPLKVIAYNVLAFKGWPEDRPNAKKAVSSGQMAQRIAWELALYEPDIVNFSESPSEALTKEVAALLKMNHVRFTSGGSWPGTILSRHEITDSENTPLGKERPKDLFTRHWGRAVIQLPWAEKLIVHSAHLYPHADPTVRMKEIPAMLESMKPDLESGASMILMGDLNHRPDTTEHQLWLDAGWVDTFVKAGRGDGMTIDAAKGRARIDYIMAAGPIANRIQESRALFEGAFRVNQADSADFALSDHVPQYAIFGSPS